MDIPTISIALERMKFSIIASLAEYEVELAEEIRQAVERYCTLENIRIVLDTHVASAINVAIREEVDRFYRSGRGRRIIRELVENRLYEDKQSTMS